MINTHHQRLIMVASGLMRFRVFERSLRFSPNPYKVMNPQSSVAMQGSVVTQGSPATLCSVATQGSPATQGTEAMQGSVATQGSVPTVARNSAAMAGTAAAARKSSGLQVGMMDGSLSRILLAHGKVSHNHAHMPARLMAGQVASSQTGNPLFSNVIRFDFARFKGPTFACKNRDFSNPSVRGFASTSKDSRSRREEYGKDPDYIGLTIELICMALLPGIPLFVICVIVMVYAKALSNNGFQGKNWFCR